MILNIEKIILEGPDLSGKSSLYENIHLSTNYKWNIQDRSALSMICYASQFDRDTTNLRRSFYKEVTNLNNRIIVLLPSLESLKKRLFSRGDKIQTLSSITNLHSIFEKEVKKIKNLPNILVIKEEMSEKDTTDKVVKWLTCAEEMSAESIGKNYISAFVLNNGKKETTLTFELTGKIKNQFDKSILKDKKEGKYYLEIIQDFRHIIDKELKGLNEYGIPQDMSSRRFYYSSRSCISSLHFKPRGKMLEFLCTLRSTNGVENGSLDVRFLEYLIHDMGNKYFFNCKDYRIVVVMNSAHLVN